MVTLTTARGPVAAQTWEKDAVAQLDVMLHEAQAHELTLITVGGGAVQLPDTVMLLLQQITHCLASGQMITLVPVEKELTTQQAADILNVSRPHVVKLLNEGKMPFKKIGTHRRIRFDDVTTYKNARDSERHAVIVRITRLAEELDELDDDSFGLP